MKKRSCGPAFAADAGRKGFVLVTTAACLIALLIVAGLATDVTRIYVVRDELQIFVDEAAIAASFELDSTVDGLDRARAVALSGPGSTPNRWNFGTQRVTEVVTKFASAAEGPWEQYPSSPAGRRFIRVTVAGSVPLYFLPLAPGVPLTKIVNVSAAAGQCRLDSMGAGLAPFAPIAHNAGAPEFGFAPGEMYTLRWAPPGHEDKPGGKCHGDLDISAPSSSERGYVDVGQGSGASNVRAAVVDNDFFLPQPLEKGSLLELLSGQQSVPDAIDTRFQQDTDVTARWFSEYRGNGRRLLQVAVNTGGDPAKVAGFAAFFLRPEPCGDKNTTPCCAEYVGPGVISSNRKGAGAGGVYEVKLIE